MRLCLCAPTHARSTTLVVGKQDPAFNWVCRWCVSVCVCLCMCLHAWCLHVWCGFVDVCACSRDSISPSGIVHRLPVIGRRLRLGRQEDAHEFLRLLLDSFQKAELRILGVKESGPRAVVESTFVHQMFGGYFRNQLKWVPSSVCAQCVCLCVRVCLYVHVWCGHWDDATHS